MENFIKEAISSIFRYLSFMLLVLFQKRKATIYFFSKKFKYITKGKINRYVVFIYSMLVLYIGLTLSHIIKGNDSSGVLPFLSGTYFKSESILFLSLPILLTIQAVVTFICWVYGLLKEKENWLDFYTITFSALFFLTGCIMILWSFLPKEESNRLVVFLGIIILAAALVIIINLFRPLLLAKKYGILRQSYNWYFAFLFFVILTNIFVYFNNLFDKYTEKQTSTEKKNTRFDKYKPPKFQFLFDNPENDKKPLVIIDSVGPNKYKLKFKCYLWFEDTNLLFISPTQISNYFGLCWKSPDTANYKADIDVYKNSRNDTVYYITLTDIFNYSGNFEKNFEYVYLKVDSAEGFLIIKRNEPQYICLNGELSRIRYERLIQGFHNKSCDFNITIQNYYTFSVYCDRIDLKYNGVENDTD